MTTIKGQRSAGYHMGTRGGIHGDSRPTVLCGSVAPSPVPYKPRRGFTLVELLVVIGIILMLAAIVAAVAPGFRDQQKVPRGADIVQGAFASARQWAKRDRVATGIRLIFDAGNTTVSELQFIQQPANFTLVTSTGAVSPVKVVGGTSVQKADGSNPVSDFFAGLSATSAPVLVGDFIVLRGVAHQISNVTATTLTLSSAASDTFGTTDYYIVRAPRPLSGEATVKLNQDTVIDCRQSRSKADTMAFSQSNRDVIFGPSGEIMIPTNKSMLFLWVCDNSKLLSVGQSVPPVSDDLIIAVTGRTGMVAAHPVNQTGDPYLFCKDGRSSGL